MVLFDSNWPRKKLAGQLIWFIVWIIVTVVAARLNPDPEMHGTHVQLGLPPCPSVLLFHRPCPGCGLTTSWTALVHGQVLDSFRAHALGPVLYLAFTATSWLGLVGWAREKRLRSDSKPANVILVSVLTLLLSYGFVRFAATQYQVSYPSVGSYLPLPWSRK